MEEKQDNKEPLSLSNKSYRLFSKGKTPIQVAITLNLSETETTKFYQEYWNLEQMHELRMVYEEMGANIVHFLKLYGLSIDAHAHVSIQIIMCQVPEYTNLEEWILQVQALVQNTTNQVF